MKSTDRKKKGGYLAKALWVLLAGFLAALLYFVYGVLPGKVAQSIVARSQVRQPITETPKDYGFKDYRDVSFTTSDGVTLSGWWLPAMEKKKPLGTILLSHGVFKNRQQVLSRAVFLSKFGYQVILFDLRGDGLSGNSPVSGGVLEANDYLAAEGFLDSRHELKKPVVFFGFSLGAIAAIRASVRAPQVDAVIADSPLPSLKSYVARRTMGGVFSFLPGFLPACLKHYDQLTGLTLVPNDLDLSQVVPHLDQTPILYITGESDDLAKPDEVRKLFEQTSTHHRRLVYIPDSSHEETYQKFPVIYEKVVTDFLTDVRTGFPKPDDDKLLENDTDSTTLHKGTR